MNDYITIFHYLGLGDHIVCNGLVRNLITSDSKYKLIVKQRNIESVKFMFRDLTNLDFLLVDDEIDIVNFINEYKSPLIKVDFVEHQSLINAGVPWDEAFYLLLGVDFNKRWTDFYIDRNISEEMSLYKKLNPSAEPYVLIHSTDASGAYRLDDEIVKTDLKKIHVTKSNTIFDYIYLIENAEEIHCIDSSFFHLVESIKVTTEKLFYHKNFNLKLHNTHHIFKKKWIVV